MMNKIELKELLANYILEFVDFSDEKLVGVFDKFYREEGLKNC